MYAKVFRSMFQGSMYGNPDGIIAFMVMLVLSDRHGDVDMTPQAISAMTSIPLSTIEAGIEFLSRPDPRSRTPDQDGRRIVLIDSHRDWGWHIVNFERYHKIRNEEERREYQADWARKARAARKELEENRPTSTERRQRSTKSTHSDVDADSDIDLRGSPSEIPVPQAGPVERVFGHWKETLGHPRANLDPKRRKLIASALNLFSEADLCAAIAGYKLSPHHMGQNDRSTVYDDIGLILRDTAHIEAGLGFYRTPPPKLSEVEQARAQLRNAGVTHGQQSNGSVGSSLGPIRLGLDPPFRKISPG
jgi:hypothetical protein